MNLQIITSPQGLQDVFDECFEMAFKKFNSTHFTPTPQPEPNQQFNIAELANYLKVTKATVHAYKNRGVFPYYQTGRTVYFKKCEVDLALGSVKKKGGKL